jgi:hypothetical protein
VNQTHLGELEESLGDLLNVLKLTNRLDAALDGVGVGGTGGVQDVLDLLLVAQPGERGRERVSQNNLGRKEGMWEKLRLRVPMRVPRSMVRPAQCCVEAPSARPSRPHLRRPVPSLGEVDLGNASRELIAPAHASDRSSNPSAAVSVADHLIAR